MNYSINIPEYKVSHFNRVFKEVIESNFDYVRIRGEISEVKIATRGQFYLILKEEVRCIYWRINQIMLSRKLLRILQ